MSTEIVRKDEARNSLTRVSDARRAMDTALARLRSREDEKSSGRSIDDARSSHVLFSHGPTNEDVIDLPRYCAVHGQPYVARYVRVNGLFHYGQSIRYKDSLEDQYTSRMTRDAKLHSHAFEEESCPWCGATGFAAILCGVCNRFMCWGKTANNYFRCAPPCDGEGYLAGSALKDMPGLSPGIDRRRASKS